MKAKLNLFGNDKFEQLQRKNRKDMKSAKDEDKPIIEEVERQLRARGVNKAYIEVIKQDMIDTSIKSKVSKTTLIKAIGGSVEDFVAEVITEAPLQSKLSKIFGMLEDASYIFMVYIAIVVLLINKPPEYSFGYPNIALMLAALIALILCNAFIGKNAIFGNYKEKNDGILRLIIATVFLVASFFLEKNYEGDFSVTALMPVAASIMAWLIFFSAGNIINNRDLKEINENYE